jgi:nucleotide-binding universal stress UspA family protein
VDAEIELVHVVDMSWRATPAPFAESAMLAAERGLRDLAARLSVRTDRAVHATVLVGHPADLLIERAADSELIVLGTRRASTIREALVRKIPARVAAGTSVSSIVVPRSAAVGRGLVVGIDGSRFSAAPLAFAAREADRLGETLTVIHSWHAPEPWSDGEVADWPTAPEDEERRVLAEAVAGIAQDYPDLPVRSSVVFARAADALCEAARGARLVVVGSHGRHGFEKAWLGSTSEELILAAPTVVAVIR